MEGYYPSVKLVEDKCIGCTDCIKRCPTEAIRVRHGKASITNEKCIDCGLCIKVCRNNAKVATTDSLEDIMNSKFSYKVAIPAPTLYSQFRKENDINRILTVLKSLGFDEVFEVSQGADIVTNEILKSVNSNQFPKPMISAACPAIVRLIQIRFPSLIPNIIKKVSPMESTARMAKNYLEKKGIKRETIGVFFISPCGAKVTHIRQPQVVGKSEVDGAVSIKEIYKAMVPKMNKIKNLEILRTSTNKGINWAKNGGEGQALGIDNFISVDGIENVISILENMENGKLKNVDYIEALACTGGCLGGPLVVENSFVAQNRINKILKYSDLNDQRRVIDFDIEKIDLDWQYDLEPHSVLKLDEDLGKAIDKLNKIDEIYEKLPKIDCGSCGSPTCKSLAGDIVNNKANIEDCTFMLRQRVREVAREMLQLSEKLPPAIGENNKI